MDEFDEKNSLKGSKCQNMHFLVFSLYFLVKIPIPRLFNKYIVNYPCSTPFKRANQGFSEALDSCAYN